ncbi:MULTISPECIES: histidine phosphatase family protein [Aerosakkonema]|uniref:histidine phosphatase family protein n=1 Tax=Aerosakkonema TaxID=1246629 RepID=UPI0035B95E46
MTTRVILVRHGQSTYNQQQRIQGRIDESVLTETGRATARQIAPALTGLTFDAIYSSPLQRAKETAEIVQSYLPNPPKLQVADKLMEIDLPLWERLHKDEVKEKFSEDYRCWKERPHELRMLVSTAAGTREHFPVLALYEQAKQFWQEVLPRHAGKTILIVAHNGINRALISTALGIPPSRYHSIQQSNCGINVLNFPDSHSFPPVDGGDARGGESVQMESMNLIDHLGDPLPKPRPGHQGPRLLLVRHGETEWNRQKKFQGQIDVPLNDNGRKQSSAAAEFLKNVQIDNAVSSPMLRPQETAEIILQYHPHAELELLVDLSEIGHGLWEGKFETEIEQEFPGLLKQWQETPETVQMPGGENLQQVWERAIAAWQSIVLKYSKESKTILVVAHDAINKAILCHLFDLGPENFWNFKQGNCAVSVIDYPQGADGYAVLQSMNITTHLGGGVLDKTAAGAL